MLNRLPEFLYNFSPPPLDPDFLLVRNIWRRAEILVEFKAQVTIFTEITVGDGERPDTIAESIYGDARLDYVVILVAGITNIQHHWPLQDYQVYNYALEKYGSEAEMNKIKFYKTFEIRDEQERQILPPNLIVDADFKIDGTSHKFPNTTRYTVRAQTGNRQLDDKDEFTVATDNIARAVTNLEYEYTQNEKRREIDVLRTSYLQNFISDFRDVVRYDKNSRYITSSLVATENTEAVNP